MHDCSKVVYVGPEEGRRGPRAVRKGAGGGSALAGESSEGGAPGAVRVYVRLLPISENRFWS